MPSSTPDHVHSQLPDLVPTDDGHDECIQCSRVFYRDPKLAVAAIVPYDSGIVLTRRAIEPAYGEWSFPSGYMNRGEVVEKAVAREVLEETELQVEVRELVGLYSTEGQAVVLAVYDTVVVGGVPAPADETLEIGIFYPNSLPPLAFEHDDRIIRDWQAIKSG